MGDESTGRRYAMACRTPWLWDFWDDVDLPGEWLEIRGPDELSRAELESFDPRYVFFPHWSHHVPASIYEQWECVCFHCTPLPYGRGGSPVQNMIVRGHEETELVALRMVEEFDAGPVYLRRPMSLLGGGDELYIRIARLALDMTRKIIANEPQPQPQSGEPETFPRRQPDESELPKTETLKDVFDFIRMLDAEGYPKAFLEHGDFRIEFSRPALRRGEVEADVSITLIEVEEES